MSLNNPLSLNERQCELLRFVQAKHAFQKRKYTNEPYWTHPFSVAGIVHNYDTTPLLTEAALCHDLLEDTDCTKDELFDYLPSIGYNQKEAGKICRIVRELTDQYTSEKYPDKNRKERKFLESLRLSNTSEEAQTIKYADLIDNTSSIVTHDSNFAKVYLQEKRDLLFRMNGGNINLYFVACWTYQEAIDSLNK